MLVQFIANGMDELLRSSRGVPDGPIRGERIEFCSPSRAWTAVVILGALYFLSFVDRLILAMLVAPLQAEFGVTNLQIGLLFGTAFALFYGTLGLPLARIADRGNRRLLIIAGVVVWCSCTVASAFATSFEMLVALRVGLAAGEAALIPAAHSMIGDLLPAERRPAAASVFTAMGTAGGSGSLLVGALVITVLGAIFPAGNGLGLHIWQWTLIAVGLPGFVLAIVFAFVVREPVRRVDPTRQAPNMKAVWHYARDHRRLYLGLFGGAACCYLVNAAFTGWSPKILTERFGISIAEAGTVIGLSTIAANFAGTIIVPIATAGIMRRRGAHLLVIICALTGLVGAVVKGSAALMPNIPLYLISSCVGGFFLQGAIGNVIVSLQQLAPNRMRGTLAALLFATMIFIGMGLGPALVAVVSDQIGGGNALGEGLALTCYLMAVLCFVLSLSSYRAVKNYIPETNNR